YAWTSSQPSFVPAIDAEVVAAVDRELAALGLAKVCGSPSDGFFPYGSLSRTDVDVKAKPAGKSGPWPEYPVGTLVVALLDPESRRQLFRARADTPIDLEPAKLKATIDASVSQMFAKYPTRKRVPHF